MPTPDESSLPDFEATHAAVSQRMQVLQAALREALDVALPSGSGVRACGRALGVTRFLGWSCWNVAYAPDLPAALHALPGARGWTTLLDALRRRGCPNALLARIQTAVEELSRRLPSGRMNAALLRSIAAGTLDSSAESQRVRRARRGARAAAEVLHGIRADANVAVFVLAPRAGTGLIDAATFSIFEGLRRIRPGPSWPIYRWSITQKSGGGEVGARRALVDSAVPPLVPGLSTPDAAGRIVRTRADRSEAAIDFVAPQDARSDAHRIVFAESIPGAGDLGDESPRADLAMTFSLPLGRAIFDIYLHREVPRRGAVTTALYPPTEVMALARMTEPGFAWSEAMRLPMAEAVEQLDSPALPRALRGADPAYRTCLAHALAALGRPAEDFELFRVELADPPMHGSLVMRWLVR